MPQTSRRSLTFAALLLTLTTCGTVTACGHDTPTPPSARPASPAAQSASPAAPPQLSTPPGVPTAEASGALPGTRTCADLSAAISRANLMEPGVVDRIVAAASTADAPVADAAQRLATAYAKATRSKNTAQEPDAVAAVSAAAADMAGVCDESGLESAG
jgi:hypothetical protein